MLKEYLQERALSLVILGNFNPVIIQPYWLSAKRLIKEVEAKEAKVKLIHPQLSQFDLDWVFIEISDDRATFNSKKEAYFDTILDLVSGVLNFLPETPIKALGINHIFNYSIPTEEQYYKIGNTFAPLNNWKDVLKDPKLLELNIVEQKRSDNLPGSYSIKIQPSELIPQFGVQIYINDHLSLDGHETGRNGEIISRTKQIWRESFERANNIGEKLWGKL